ncbi:MAG: ABC transporter permease [Pseudomonadota bacterium]
MTGGTRTAVIASWALLSPALIASIVFFAAPLVYLVVDSFRAFSLTAGVGGFTLGNYSRILGDAYYLRVLGDTFRLAAMTTALCLILGYPLALLLRAAPPRLKALMVIAVIAPLLVSVVVRSFGWVVILGEFGLLNQALRLLGVTAGFASTSHLFTEAAVIVGLVHVFLPFMVLALYSALQKQEARLVRAARSLGASTLRAFIAVTLPLSVPGIVAGTTTVFALAAGSYVTVSVLGGSKVMVIAILAYQQSIGLTNWQLGAAIGIVLLIGTTLILQLYQATLRRLFPRVLAV